MKLILILVCLLGIARAQDVLHSKHPNHGIAGAYHSVFFDPLGTEAEYWIWADRICYVSDALQTRDIVAAGRESNRLYKGMSPDEAVAAVLIFNWLEERAVTGIRNPHLREYAGWILTAFEFDVVAHNFRMGFAVRF